MHPYEAAGSPPGRWRAEDGFMYVEILIAMFILSLALLAVVPLYVASSHENGAARDLMLATAAAQDKVEELKVLYYSDLADGADEILQGGLSYQRSWTVQTDTPHAGMSTITVTVSADRTNTVGGNRNADVRFYRYE